MGTADRRSHAEAAIRLLGSALLRAVFAVLPRVACVALLLLPGSARAEEFRLVMDPEATEIRFEVEATLNSVKGRLQLLEGDVAFDPETGAAQGRVVVDAVSAETGNRFRDRHMHETVLLSGRFPRIVLDVEALRVATRDADGIRGTLLGRMQIQGRSHPVAIPISATRTTAGRGRVEGELLVPYVAWGLTDVSNFVLRVGKVVTLQFEAEGRLVEPAPRSEPPPQ